MRNNNNTTPKMNNSRIAAETIEKKPSRSSQKHSAKQQAESTGVSKTANNAKAKLKNLQSKKSNQRLAKLEKMYQELTEIEAKSTKN